MSVRVIASDEELPPGGVDLPDGDDAIAAAVLAVVNGATAVRAADTARARRAVHIAERLAAARTR
jgi:hypothetical protein